MAGLIESRTRTHRPAVATSTPTKSTAPPLSFALSPFDNLFAPQIAAWPKSDEELLWLAPGTLPPLTAVKVAAWQRNGGHPILFWSDDGTAPVGYSELNRMPNDRRSFWIGHFVIDPAMRGREWGQVFLRGLIMHAFESLRAAKVLLVVFPKNVAAIRCYQRGGMIIAGRETKYFKSTGQRHEFLRMTIHRRRFEKLAQYRGRDATRLPFAASAYDMLAAS